MPTETEKDFDDNDNEMTSIESAISAAYDEHTGDEPTEDTQDEPLEATSETEEEQAPDGPASENGGEEAKEPAAAASDEGGEPGAVDAEVEGGDPEATPVKGNLDAAPGKWAPAAREQWSNLPEDVRKEIKFRESKMDTVLQESANARKTSDAFTNLVTPYIPIMQAAGAKDPMSAIGGLLNTAAGLQMGTVAQKAEGIASLINQYNVDITTLDNILSGQAPQDGTPAPDDIQAQIQAGVDQALTPYTAAINERKNQQKQGINDEIQAFRDDSANEFFDDVYNDVANILEINGRAGRSMTLGEAYTMACNMNPEVKAVIDNRNLLKNAEKNQQKAQRHANAASSINAGPGGHAQQKGVADSSILGAINAAWDATSDGR